MKQQLWILNSALLLFLLFALGFIGISWYSFKIPPREDIEPSGVVVPLKGEAVKINISKIYENDLFGTYRKELPTYEAGGLPALPEPPLPKPVSVPPVPTPQFLDPLAITLRGIIVMLDDDTQNRAIIADNKTNKESTFRIGQYIEDAQLIRILNNKVIFLRSNGQQEVLYLREKDAKLDPSYVPPSNWAEVVEKVSDFEFNINMQEFTQRVKNLAQFIDMLDLITVYNNGKSVGCRVGPIAPKSLGTELGLRDGDIIIEINSIPTTNTMERFKIYKQIIAMQPDDTINVVVVRNRQRITIQYILKEFKTKEKERSVSGAAQTATVVQDTSIPSSDYLQEQKIKSMKQRYKMAPTLKEIREQEKRNMFKVKPHAGNNATTKPIE